jgi:hypothetical protein
VETVSKILGFGTGLALAYFFFSPSGTFARWQVVDGWTLKGIADFHTRRGAQDFASELNDEIQWQGWHSRYHTIHKAVTKEWRRA